MQRLLVADVPVGARLVQAARDIHGRLIYEAGTVIDATHLQVLKRLLNGTVAIEDVPNGLGLPSVAQICPDVIAQVAAILSATHDRVRSAGPTGLVISNREIRDAGRVLLNAVLGTFSQPLQIEPIRAGQDYAVLHPIRTAILSLRLGISLNLLDEDVARLAASALLLDIGMILLPAGLGNHPGPLLDDETTAVRTHPRRGQELLKRHGFDPVICAIVLQHHERWAGSGYPFKRAGKDIYRLARLIALVSDYIALLSDRPFRRGYLPHEALEYLLAYAGDWHDPELVHQLVTNVPAYPMGSRVVVDGDVGGTVVDANADQPGRPIVRLDDGFLLDLAASNNLQRYIVAVPMLNSTEARAPVGQAP